MTRFAPARNTNDRKRPTPHVQHAPSKLPVRTALVLALALLVAIGDVVLLLAAHLAVPLIVISAVVAFVGAFKFLDGLIE